MTLNRVKLGCAVTFMKYLTSVVFLIYLAETLFWIKVTFAESCRTGGKWAYVEYIQRNLQKFFFIFDFALCNVSISRAYN